MNIIINEVPVKTEHVCWFTLPGKSIFTIKLVEVVKNYYYVPGSDNRALIPVLDERVVKEYTRMKIGAGHVVVLEAAQSVVTELEKKA
jgi:hypothetical protein